MLLVVLHQCLGHVALGMKMALSQDRLGTGGLQGLLGWLPAVLQGPAQARGRIHRVDLG